MSITNGVTTSNGYPTGSTQLTCVHAGCSAATIFSLDVEFTECEIPTLDLSFWLTDFGISTEYLAIGINGHLYGWCDGGKDDDFKSIHTCLHKADIEEWADWDVHGNELELTINASSNVNGLDANKDGYLVNAVATLTCEPRANDRKTIGADVNPVNKDLKSVIVPIECQGVGCYTYSLFHIRNGICYQPRLSVAFWLSDFKTFDEYATVYVNNQELQKCYGGGDRDFDAIWSCFSNKDIRYILHDYPYNDHGDIEGYYIDTDDALNVSLQMSQSSVWLDHSRNYSLLEGTVTLTCQPNNDPVIVHVPEGNNSAIITPDRPIEDIKDSDNSSFRFVQFTIIIQNVHPDTILTYHDEIRSRLEYSLDATIHFEDDNKDTIPFTLRTDVDAITNSQLSDLKIYITTFSNNDAREMKRLIEMEIFLFILQETLRDSHFSGSVLESITNVQLTSSLPQS